MHTTKPAPAPAPLQFTRRRFLQTAAAASVGIIAGAPFISRAWAASGAKSPFNNLVPATRKVRYAAIGCGGKGYSDMTGVINAGAELVALCDVDFSSGARAFREHGGIPRYRDFRQMFDEMGDRIDAVTVTVPDHMHFPIAMMALERGKHIYVQKPLTHTIGEARALKAAAAKYGLVTQMGNQGHANDGTRLTKEWIEAGVIGNVREVHSWTNRPIWDQGVHWPRPGDATTGKFGSSGKGGKKGTKPGKSGSAPDSAAAADSDSDSGGAALQAPADLAWNLWLGVAPYRDFLPNLLPFKWRSFWDYGCGALGDMGCHIMDAPFWALNLTGDCKVTAESDGAATMSISAPKASTIKYEFPARGPFPAMTYTWYDGGRHPKAPKELGAEELAKGGTLYYGDKGIMYSNDDYGRTIRLLPAERMKSFTDRPAKKYPRPPKADPYLEWITAILGGPVPGSNIPGHSADLTEFVSLGNVALRAGQPIQWDAATATCVGLPEAQSLINKNFRAF